MRRVPFGRAILAAVFVCTLTIPTLASAQDTLETAPLLVERDLSGPRFGFTLRPGGRVSDSRGLGPVVSQFGWHFEHHVSPEANGPQFVTEFVPLVAGVESGKFLPSASLGFGVRLPDGYEFGLGPTISTSRNEWGQPTLRSALFLAAGRSFPYSGVHIPVNLVVTTNQDGSRVSLIVGYAIRRSTRRIAP